MAKKLHIDWSNYNLLCEKLILQIAESGYQIDLVVAIMRGGAIPADLISRVLKKNTAYLCAKSYTGEKTEDVYNEEIIFSREISTTVKDMGGKLLLVDDLLDSSRTMREALKFLKNYEPLKGQLKDIKTAVILPDLDTLAISLAIEAEINPISLCDNAVAASMSN